MIDFTGVSAIHIPEGAVARITNASGVVLWEKADAPEENYTILDYIKFNADMVFDTGVICNQDTKIEVRFTRETSESRFMFGVRTADNKATVSAQLTTNGEWRFGGAYRKLTMSNATTVRNVTMDKSKLVYGSSNYTYTGTVGTFTCPYALTIGSARAADGAIASPSFIGKMYYFRIYDGDTLIREYVGAKNSAGVSGLYDNVSGKFLRPVEAVVSDEAALFEWNGEQM